MRGIRNLQMVNLARTGRLLSVNDGITIPYDGRYLNIDFRVYINIFVYRYPRTCASYRCDNMGNNTSVIIITIIYAQGTAVGRRSAADVA